MSVQKTRPHPDRLLVKFAGISDRVSAQKLRGLEVFIEEHQRRTLDSQEFWPDQLEGLEARTPSGEVVGRVTEVEYAAVQHRLVIETESGLRQVPFVDELVPSVNVEEGYLILADIPGLL